MVKKLSPVFLLFFAVMTAEAYSATGVASIHGKGGTSGHLFDDYAYWGSDMLKASTNSYAVPYLVCHYDGTVYMRTAASTVADQICSFIDTNKITDLVIDTHSFGGTVVRWIFSNAASDARVKKIVNVTRYVNTIAGPYKGSEAADLAGTLSV